MAIFLFNQDFNNHDDIWIHHENGTFGSHSQGYATTEFNSSNIFSVFGGSDHKLHNVYSTEL